MNYDNPISVRVARCLVLLLVQVLVVNHMHLFGYVTPLIVGYMIVCFEKNTPRLVLIGSGFITGLLFDIFSNTMGMCSAAMTLLGFVQPILLQLFMPRDATADFKPSILTMGFLSYFYYILISMLIIHGVFYILDAFSGTKFWLILGAIIGSTLLSTMILMFIDMIAHNKNEKL